MISESNPVITTESHVIEDGYVASLFCTERKEWDMDLIRDVFKSRDQEKILSIPLDVSEEEDILYWRLENTGMYSVKSAYKL